MEATNNSAKPFGEKVGLNNEMDKIKFVSMLLNKFQEKYPALMKKFPGGNFSMDFARVANEIVGEYFVSAKADQAVSEGSLTPEEREEKAILALKTAVEDYLSEVAPQNRISAANMKTPADLSNVGK